MGALDVATIIRVQMEVPFDDMMAHFVNQRTQSGVISPNAVWTVASVSQRLKQILVARDWRSNNA